MNKFSIIRLIAIGVIAFTMFTGGTGKEVLASYSTGSYLSIDELYEKRSNSYNMIHSALSSNDPVGYFDTSEMDYLDVGYLIKDLIKIDPNRFYIKNWVVYDSGKIKFNYVETIENIRGKNESLNKKVDKILKEIVKPNYTDFDKVKAVHDYLVLNTAYDYENYRNGTTPNDSYTAYGALVLGVAVCDGYTRAANLLLDRLDIESIYVHGSISEGLHSWNMVKLDGSYFHMDVTWDDPVPNKEGFVSYKYFLVDSEELAKDHTWNQQEYPVSDNKKYLKDSRK